MKEEKTPSLNPEPSFPVDEMYMDKKNTKRSLFLDPQPCSPMDQLYAQVDKEKSTTQIEEPSSSIDLLYM